MRRSTIVVGIVGGLAIVLPAAGLWEVHSRAGPFDKTLSPVEFTRTSAGTYLARSAQGSTGPGGLCVPDSVGGTCSPPRLEVDLRLSGLPRVPAPAVYLAFLTVADDVLLLGPLAREGERDVVRYQADRDATRYRTLVVTLEWSGAATKPGPVRVYDHRVEGLGRTTTAPLDGNGTAMLLDGSGAIHSSEIGMMAKSVVASGDLRTTRVADWTYSAWFESIQDHPTYLGLGILGWDEAEDRAFLDARVEGVRLEDQRRLVVTIAPTRNGDDAGPGLVVFAASLE